MNKLFTFLKSIFKRKSEYYVKIDSSGASTAMNMISIGNLQTHNDQNQTFRILG